MRAAPFLLASFAAASAAQAEMWTETFEVGFGRFTIIAGSGESAFVYDPNHAALHATFVRRDSTEHPVPDRRLALLEQAVTASDFARFSVEWTPLAESGSCAWPLIGFFDAATGDAVARVLIGNGTCGGNRYVLQIGSSHEWSPEPGVEIPPWELGETYRLQLTLDGPARVLSLHVSILEDGAFIEQGGFIRPFPTQLQTYAFDALGIGNIIDNQFINSTFVARLDNFRFRRGPCIGDITGDEYIGLDDLGILLADYSCNGGICSGDVNGDGSTNLSDLGLLLAAYGTSCP